MQAIIFGEIASVFREKESVKGYFTRNIVVKESAISGLGVFATEDIPLHACIEAAPYLSFATSLLEDFLEMYRKEHLLKAYVFKAPDGTHALAMGYGGMYNHSSYPNAFWKFRGGNEKAIMYYAKRDIKKGEEIFIKYGSDSKRLTFIDEKETERLVGLGISRENI